MIEQLRVRLPNQPGALARMVSALAEAKVDMKALDVSDRAGDYGEACLIVSNQPAAIAALEATDHDFSVEATLCVEVDDRVGGLAPVLKTLEAEGINVKQLYAFVSRVQGKSVAVLQTSEPDKTLELFKRKGFYLLSQRSIDANRGPDGNDPLVDHLGVDFIW